MGGKDKDAGTAPGLPRGPGRTLGLTMGVVLGIGLAMATVGFILPAAPEQAPCTAEDGPTPEASSPRPHDLLVIQDLVYTWPGTRGLRKESAEIRIFLPPGDPEVHAALDRVSTPDPQGVRILDLNRRHANKLVSAINARIRSLRPGELENLSHEELGRLLHPTIGRELCNRAIPGLQVFCLRRP